MNGSECKIKFNYLYRDAGNYKDFGYVIFKSEIDTEIETVEKNIRLKLIDGEYFIPEKWGIPRVNTSTFDPELDHEWYEFINLESSNEVVSDKRTFEEFLKML